METSHILGLWIIVLIAWLVFSIFKTELQEILSHKSDSATIKKDIYDVELYFENGELFKQYSNVYVTHWDNNIYIFKNESINELVHKSENITLIRKKIA